MHQRKVGQIFGLRTQIAAIAVAGLLGLVVLASLFLGFAAEQTELSHRQRALDGRRDELLR